MTATTTWITAAEVCRELHIPGSVLSRAVKAGVVAPDARAGRLQLFKPESVSRISAKLTTKNTTR
jgi:hypothetical protein